MNNNKIRKILIIISIIVIIFGILSGISISNELTHGLKNTNNTVFIIDGSDFSSSVKAFVSIGSSFIGFVVVLYTFAIVLVIWAIYAIVLLVIKAINKIKQNFNSK